MGQQMGELKMAHVSLVGLRLPLCSAWAASELPGLLRSHTDGDFLQNIITPMCELTP